MTTETTYPAWTRDGTRPWHHRTHDRALTDGRTVRVWLGSHNEWRSHARLNIQGNNDYDRGLSEELFAILAPISYWETTRGEDVRGWHPGRCQLHGWIGIAYLPADPRPTTAAWLGWKHIAHATRDWTELLPEYERIAALPDDELVALLER